MLKFQLNTINLDNVINVLVHLLGAENLVCHVVCGVTRGRLLVDLRVPASPAQSESL